MLEQYKDLTFVSMLKDLNLFSKVKLFDPDSLDREWPEYEDPLWQEISGIVNLRGNTGIYDDPNRPPFIILDAEKSSTEKGIQDPIRDKSNGLQVPTNTTMSSGIGRYKEINLYGF